MELQEWLRPPPSAAAASRSPLSCEMAGTEEPPAPASRSAQALLVCDSVTVLLATLLDFAWFVFFF